MPTYTCILIQNNYYKILIDRFIQKIEPTCSYQDLIRNWIFSMTEIVFTIYTLFVHNTVLDGTVEHDK